jgi:hypothetical protein
VRQSQAIQFDAGLLLTTRMVSDRMRPRRDRRESHALGRLPTTGYSKSPSKLHDEQIPEGLLAERFQKPLHGVVGVGSTDRTPTASRAGGESPSVHLLSDLVHDFDRARCFVRS